MESNSNLRSLSQALQLKKATDAAEVASVTNAELQKLGSDLQRQSSAVLTTTALSITQSAAKEMQQFEQQIAPELRRTRQELALQLQSMQGQLSPQVTQMQKDVSQRLEAMQAQLDSLLQPMDEQQLKKRMGSIQGQINAQTKPLIAALSAVKKESEALSRMTAKAWLKPVLISLAVLISISLPAWGLMQYLASQVQSNLMLIAQQEQTLAKLQEQTRGMEIRQESGGTFLVMAPGVTPETGFKVGSRQAVKLLQK